MARVHGRRDVAGERPRAERADIYHELADIRTDRHDIFLDKYGAPAESRLCADEPRHLPGRELSSAAGRKFHRPGSGDGSKLSRAERVPAITAVLEAC